MKIFSAPRLRVLVPALFILVVTNLLLSARLLQPVLRPETASPASAALEVSSKTPETTPTLAATLPPVLPSPLPNTGLKDRLGQQGVIVLSMRDGAYFHLFAYQPQFLPLTRLNDTDWDDISPAVSPDGTRIAYSSHQSGSWDLYLMDTANGQTTRLTDTPEYEGNPSWSPDGDWLAYESYKNKNLDIYRLSTRDLTQAPIQVTDDPAADYDPAWSPDGRSLAFVSTRSGEEEIWTAAVQGEAQTPVNISQNSNQRETHPAWSPNGRFLAWSAAINGLNTLEVWDSQNPSAMPKQSGYGVEPVWDPSGQALLARVILPNQNGMSVFAVESGLTVLPFTGMPGDLRGMAWVKADAAIAFAGQIEKGSTAAAEPLYKAQLSQFPVEPAGRYSVVNVADIQAPYPMLHDSVDESFKALREATAARTGWDFLGNLENAFQPLTQPSIPGLEEDWLYTGRAFAANPVLLHAGWMAVVREDINGQTYWRLYLKARFQDGSQGLPMTERPWDLDARNNGDPKVYEQGGLLAPIPEGYWIDFTEMAGRYGWERLPALVNWITYYPSARFTQFIMSEGMDWRTAMSELYPPEALATATAAPTATVTPSPSPTSKGKSP